MLRVILAGQIHVRLSSSSLRSLLQRLDLRFGRPHLVIPRKVNPEKAAKQWAIVRAIVEAEVGTTVLCADESRTQLLPILRAMGHWVGQQVRVPTPRTNVTRAVFGALNCDSGQWNYLIRERMGAADFVVFLDYLLSVYPAGPLLVIVDNYGNPTAHRVHDWLADHPRLRLLFLPKNCSHLDPVEPIWRRLKDKVAANGLSDQISSLVEEIEAFFRAITPGQALTWAAPQNVQGTYCDLLGSRAHLL